MGFADTLFDAIRITMPDDADIKSVSRDGNVSVCVTWQLGGDSGLPQISSKTVLISIGRDTLFDLDRVLPPRQQAASANLLEFLAFKLHNFELTEDRVAVEKVRHEEWVILYRDLLGRQPNDEGAFCPSSLGVRS